MTPSKVENKRLFNVHSMGWGDMLNSCELTGVITAIANSIAHNLTSDGLTLLASVLVQLGDTLATISARRGVCKNKDK